MKMDRIFVLLLVVLLPMTGCFDDAVGDAEGTDDADDSTDTGENEGTSTNTTGNNHPPVISAAITGSVELTEDQDCMTDGVQFEARHAMTDWDGNIAQAGWDTDLDGTIDHVVTDSEGHTMLQIPLNEMSYWNDTVNTGSLISADYNYVYRQQSVVFGAQDDAGEWTSSELFLIQITESYTTSGSEHNYFDIEPCQDFEDVTQYTFNAAAHPSFNDSSDMENDYLVEITRTNGQSGIDWNRVTIFVYGSHTNAICTVAIECLVLSGSGNTTTLASGLWEAGETISIRENLANIHSNEFHLSGSDPLEIRIMIDGIQVFYGQYILY